MEKLRNQVEELNVHNEGGSMYFYHRSGIYELKINNISHFFFVSCIGEKQIQSLKDQMNRSHMEFMMANIKLEQMKKLTDNECEKVYSLSQQRQELTEVRFTYDTCNMV